MRILLSGLCLSGMLLTPSLWADEPADEAGENDAEESPRAKETSPPKSEKKKPPLKRLDDIQARLDKIEATLASSYEDEVPGSSENRVGKRADILVGGSAVQYKAFDRDFSETATQISGSYYIKPDLKAGIAYRSGTSKMDQTEGLPTLSADLKGYSLQGSYFLGNSIKVNLGLHSNETSSEGAEPLRIQSLGIGLGNQWNWESFVIAWDWFNYEAVLSAKQGSVNLKDEIESRYLLTSFSIGWAF